LVERMADVDPELIYTILKRLQEGQAELRQELRSMGADIRTIKDHLGALIRSEARQDGDLAALTVRVERIERRLDLIDD
jgi:hypothetical protein